MDQIVHISENPLPRSFNAVLSLLDQGYSFLNTYQAFDFENILSSLRNSNLINHNQEVSLLRIVSENEGNLKKQRFAFFIGVIESGVPFQQLMEIILPFNDRLADFMMARGGLFPRMSRTSPPNQELRSQLFATLKNFLDGGVIGSQAISRSEFFKKQAASELNKLHNNNSLDEQQRFADRYVIFTILFVQQCTDNRKKERALTKMLNNTPNCLNDNFVKTMYHCKMARVMIAQGNLTEAETHKDAALQLAVTYFDPFLSGVVAIDILHVYREMYSGDWNEKKLNDRINLCAFGLYGHDDHFLQRMIYLNLALVCLGINDQLKVRGLAEVTLINRHIARQLLYQIQNNLISEIEPRRNMMFCLAMARANDDKTDLDFAISYTERARQLASENSFFDVEVSNIEEYLRFLRARRPGRARLSEV